MRALVVGAREGSLGDHVAFLLRAAGHGVITAGIGDEEQNLDLESDDYMIRQFLRRNSDVTDIVCTVGINQVTHPGSAKFQHALERDFAVNTLGPLTLLDEWTREREGLVLGSFVAVSSNSAHVARSTSLGYCASKAALSMGIRCAARYLAGNRSPISAWAVEPGWIEDTPMSKDVAKRIPNGHPSHRIPGGIGLDARTVAQFIVNGMLDGGRAYNGCTFRLDGGDQ